MRLGIQSLLGLMLVAGLFVAIPLAAPGLSGAAAQTTESVHEGYYYPTVTSQEVFKRRIVTGARADRATRIAFVTALTKAQLAAPDTPPYVIFAKGQEAQKLMIVGLDDQMFKTLFRARAVLARLTSNSRGTAFFRENDLQTFATFYDLLVILGFETLTISDGENWAHRVDFQQ